MSILDDILREDAAFTLDADLVPGAESVTVLPPGDGATARTVTAVVDYYPPDRTRGEGAMAPKRVIVVRNHATLGISADEVERFGAMRVTLPVSPGSATTETLRIYIPPPENGPWVDAGMLTLWLV